jgi:hypothetical protein
MPLNAAIEQLQALSSAADSAACGPNLNRASLSACGGSSTNYVAVPADCGVEKVGGAGQMALTCKKREIELGTGSVFLLQHVPPKM